LPGRPPSVDGAVERGVDRERQWLILAAYVHSLASHRALPAAFATEVGLTGGLPGGSVSAMSGEMRITSPRASSPAAELAGWSWFSFYGNPPAMLAGRGVVTL
jgi:hypothetical protein